MKCLASAFILVFASAPVLAQAGEPITAVATLPEPAPAKVLPANTEIMFRVNDTITTKGNAFAEGDTFSLSVAQDVMLDGYVVIPRNTRAVAKITWLTSKGAFGKSGKMEIALQYVEVNGSRLPIEGTYRQEGEGNTVATVGGVVAAGVFAGFITGRSATIPQGRELVGRTTADLPVRIAAQSGPMAAQGFSRSVSERAQAFENAAPKQSWGLVTVKTN